ncbi:LOW QUALITY PROTEIN: hypothetical protein TorRG33x02_169510 [Trema orientale]|uniref:Uncharacterized protein n=1 Tax=Trema orientale TaxID=63057 RepID=A0A2P5EPC0_TREOI|nr:LOW QUALITY PROTEIN: hypothetical protein TorRG33x02_169510 [Trema orientale]
MSISGLLGVTKILLTWIGHVLKCWIDLTLRKFMHACKYRKTHDHIMNAAEKLADLGFKILHENSFHNHITYMHHIQDHVQHNSNLDTKP